MKLQICAQLMATTCFCYYYLSYTYVAQLVEHRDIMREAVSSTPAGPTLRVNCLNCLNCPASARTISSLDFKHPTSYNISFILRNSAFGLRVRVISRHKIYIHTFIEAPFTGLFSHNILEITR